MGNELIVFCKASLCPASYIPPKDVSIGESKQVLVELWASLELHECCA